MMKRTFLAIIFSLILLVFVLQVQAAASPQDIIGQQLGVSGEQLNNIPQTPAEAQDIFLKQAWSELIANNKYLGPLHRFFSTISPLFLVLFGENYSLSPTLLVVIIFWVYFAMEFTIILNSAAFLNSWANRGIAVGLSILLAQIGAYRSLATFFGDLVYSQELWWLRVLIGVGLVIGLFILHYIMKMFEGQIKANKRAAKEEIVEEELKKQDAFIKGIKQGTKL